MNILSKFQIYGDMKVGIYAKLVYLILLEHSDKKGEVVIPQRKISEALSISKGTVSRNLRRLKRSGYIEIHDMVNSYGGRAPNKYIIR